MAHSPAQQPQQRSAMDFPRTVMITNDDGPPGPAAPFLLPFARALQKALRTAAAERGAPAPGLFVCTPAAQQSWTGKQITRCDRMRVSKNWSDAPGAAMALVDACARSNPDEVALWATVEGSPASSCNVGLHLLCPFEHGVDLVVAGPNTGRNTGRSFMVSSGTVGAALEASLRGGSSDGGAHPRRTIAMSFGYARAPDAYSAAQIDDACRMGVQVILRLYAHWPAASCAAAAPIDLFNVNVPLGLANGMDTRVLMTHAIRDEVGSVYRRCNDPDPSSGSSSDALPQNFDALHTTDSDAARVASPESATSMPSSIAPLSHSFATRFAVDFSVSHSSCSNWLGSDLWAVQRGFVSVTPLSSSLTECEHTHPELATIAALYPPEASAPCAASPSFSASSPLAPSAASPTSPAPCVASALISDPPDSVLSAEPPAAAVDVDAAAAAALDAAPSPASLRAFRSAAYLLADAANASATTTAAPSAGFVPTNELARLMALLPSRLYSAAQRWRKAHPVSEDTAAEGRSLSSSLLHALLPSCPNLVRQLVEQSGAESGQTGATGAGACLQRAFAALHAVSSGAVPVATLAARASLLCLRSLMDGVRGVATFQRRTLLCSTDLPVCAMQDAEMRALLALHVRPSYSLAEGGPHPLADLALAFDPTRTAAAAALFQQHLLAHSSRLYALGVTDLSRVQLRGARSCSLHTPSQLDPNRLRTADLAKAVRSAFLSSSSGDGGDPDAACTVFSTSAASLPASQSALYRSFMHDFEQCEQVGPLHYVVFDVDVLDETQEEAARRVQTHEAATPTAAMDADADAAPAPSPSPSLLSLRCDVSFGVSHPSLFEGMVYLRDTSAAAGLPLLAAQIVPDDDDYGSMQLAVSSYLNRVRAVAHSEGGAPAAAAATTTPPPSSRPLLLRIRRIIQLLTTGADSSEQIVRGD